MDKAGSHVVFRCAGVPASVEIAIKPVQIHGSIVEVTLATRRSANDANRLVYKEATYKGSLSHNPEDWKSVISKLSDGSL